MIKVQNNLATREPIPSFLVGLKPESLADLSWTDPALGVSDCVWWPEVDQSPALGEYQRYGAETLTVDAATQRVLVTRAVEPWTAEEIAADRKSKVPQSVTMRQARLALLAAGVLDQVSGAVAAAGQAAQIEWEYAQTVDRVSPLIAQLTPALGFSESRMDELFTAAAAL